MTYLRGDWNMICQRSGFKVLASDTKQEWNGLYVRIEDWEARHPQDFIKGVRDPQAVKDPRPELPDSFLTDNEVSGDDL